MKISCFNELNSVSELGYFTTFYYCFWCEPLPVIFTLRAPEVSVADQSSPAARVSDDIRETLALGVIMETWLSGFPVI